MQKAQLNSSSSRNCRAGEKEVSSLPLRAKEARVIRLMRDESNSGHPRGKSALRHQQLQEYAEGLKREVFELKEDKQQLEKRMLELVEEFKNRKGFYVSEIKKLTDIINMSSFDVRALVLEKTKEAQLLLPKLEGPRYNEHSRELQQELHRYAEDSYRNVATHY
jgi:predicted transcriptional regulator